MKLTIFEEFSNENESALAKFGYKTGRRGSFKTFDSRDGYNDITVFIYDDGRVRYDADDPTDNINLNNSKYAVTFIDDMNNIDTYLYDIDRYINDFMTEYGYIDDGLEITDFIETEDDE